MNSILLTGGLGFIGSHLASLLDGLSSKIVILDNLSNSDFQVFVKIKKLFKSDSEIIFIKGSIHDKNIINNILSFYEIDSVIHFAGLKAVGESVVYPGLYHYNNVHGSRILLESLKKNNIRNIVFSSSATVYGSPKFLPINETHPLKATNPYAQNKIDIESLFKNDLYFQEECSVKILRYFNPVGAHPSGIIGENPKGIPNNLMPFIVRVALGKYPMLNIFGSDYETIDGTGVRDYIHVMDLAEGHIKALNFEDKGISIFNLGTGKGYSVLELINTFEEVNNIKINYQFVHRRLGDVASVFSDASKAKKYLNFETKINLEDMCRDAWNYYVCNN